MRKSIIKEPSPLKIALKDCEVSISDLSDELNVTRQAIYNWMSGKSFPTRKALRRLEKLFPGIGQDMFEFWKEKR